MDSDKKVEEEIKQELLWDERLDNLKIDVSVSNGVAILEGTVHNYTEKLIAESDAKVLGAVTSVINNLDVELPSHQKIPNEIEIKRNIKTIFDMNSKIDSSKIDIDVHEGEVTLKGTVDSYWEKDKVEEFTSEVAGVIAVHNRISIVPTKNTSDEKIANDIISSISRSPRTDPDKVNIRVKNGTVTLSGTVSSYSAYISALNAVKFTKGVKEIKNLLKWVLRYDTT
ncbi:MAG: BON domain-containing protein [Candidatus Lokiarchaeota archaeon]